MSSCYTWMTWHCMDTVPENSYFNSHGRKLYSPPEPLATFQKPRKKWTWLVSSTPLSETLSSSSRGSMLLSAMGSWSLGGTVVPPYCMDDQKTKWRLQCKYFHLVVNSMRLKTVRSAIWRCPNSTVALRLLENVVKVTNQEVVKIEFCHLPILLLFLLQPA